MFEEVPKNRRYAYARVSSKSQEDNSSLKGQKAEFLRLGVPVKNIRVEVGSAADKIEDRPVFYHLIDDELKENDLLLVIKIDRCSRNTLEFLKLQERLHKKGVRFISLDLPYSNDMAVNQLISTNLAAIATFENERRKERQRQGIQAAKKNGKYLGPKTVIDKKLISQVQDLKETKNLSITEISKITGRARNTIYKNSERGIKLCSIQSISEKRESGGKSMNLDIKNSKDLRCEVLSFKSEKLEVDYITLNISIEGHVDPKGIGEFLFGYGFNSKVLEHENAEGEKLFFSNKNKYDVILVKSNWNPQENCFWNGIAARFAGYNGKFFYHLLKQNRIRFGIVEHCARNGGRVYVREVDGVIEILGKSGKKKSNQQAVINRLKEIYG